MILRGELWIFTPAQFVFALNQNWGFFHPKKQTFLDWQSETNIFTKKCTTYCSGSDEFSGTYKMYRKIYNHNYYKRFGFFDNQNWYLSHWTNFFSVNLNFFLWCFVDICWTNFFSEKTHILPPPPHVLSGPPLIVTFFLIVSKIPGLCVFIDCIVIVYYKELYAHYKDNTSLSWQ